MLKKNLSLIVVRHGESEANQSGIVSDKKVDHKLTSVGVEQAQEAAKALRNERIEHIFASSRQRARLTAEIINQYHNLDIIKREDLIERDFGIIGGKPVDDISSMMIREDFSWINIPGSESIQEVDFRIQKFINFLEINYSNTRILVATHDDIVKSFYRLINGVSVEDSMLLKIKNSTPYYFG